MNLITDNPYRILGVFVNTPLKERTSNINRFKAFIKVEKPVETDADFSIVLGQSPNRTLLVIEEANNDLNLPIERLKRTFFWFACTNQAEAIAFRHLSSGDINKATSIFEKFSSWSSLLNYHTLSLMKGELAIAIQALAKIIDFQKESLFEALNLETLKINNDDIYKLYIEELSKAYNPLEILKATREILSEGHLLQKITLKSVGDRYISKINNLVAEASSIAKTDAISNLHGGQILKKQASPILNELREIYGDRASEYMLIADKLALQILQNGICYYNNTSDFEAARIVMPLFEYSKSIAVGHLAKSRCEDDYKTIKEAYDDLPPAEIVDDIKAIERLLNKFPEDTNSALRSKELVINCAPYLGNIKEKCGFNHVAAIRISTQIVTKALNSIIADVNNALDSLNTATHLSKYTERTNVKRVLSDACEAILCLDKLPLHDNAQLWYLVNCDGLKEIMKKAGVSTMRFSSFSIQTEPEYFHSCKTKTDYIKYLKTYPNARYKQIAQKRIEEFEREEKIERERRAQEEALRQEARKKLIEEINASISLSQLWALQHQCADNETLLLLDNKAWSLCKKRTDYKEYLSHLPKGKNKVEADKKSKNIGNKILDFLTKHKGWTIFFSIVIFILALIGIIFGLEGYLFILYAMGVIGILGIVIGVIRLFDYESETPRMDLTFFIGGLAFVIIAIGGVISTEIYLSENKDLGTQRDWTKEYEIYSRFINNPTEENFKDYIKDFRNGAHIDEVAALYINLIKSKGPIALNNFKNDHPVIANDFRVQELITQMCDSLYAIAEAKNSFKGWKDYQNVVPSDEYRDSDVRKDKANTQWNTEASAWKTAQELNTIAAYSHYIELYPKGKHHAQADKILIDAEVANVFSSDHGTLPAMDKTSHVYGSTSSISVYNNTSYTLTLLYSGPESKRLTLTPHGKGTIKLKNGSYRVAASASTSTVQNYAGTENLEGGSYEVEYYVETSSYPTYNKY